MKSASHIYFLDITHQTQGRDDINGLMQERRNSIANALEHVFLAPSHPYKECHLCPHPPFIISFNAMKSIWQCLKVFYVIIGQCTEHIASHIILYYDISRVPYCDCQIRDTQPLPPLPILKLIIEVKLTLSSHSTLFPRYVADIVLL